MEPTLRPGQHVRIYPGGPFRVGEVVAFHPPTGAPRGLCGHGEHTLHVGGSGQACDTATLMIEEGLIYFRRIVAGPGDSIYIKGGHVYRRTPGSSRFVVEQDANTLACGGQTGCDFPKPITIRPGAWFVMNDNRSDTNDSRLWGPVSSVLGIVHPCRLVSTTNCTPTG